MSRKYLCLVLGLLAALISNSQQAANPARSQLTIMVLPHTSGNEDILQRVENDEGYKQAMIVIYKALSNMGYQHILDFIEHTRIVKERIKMGKGTSATGLMNIYIENALVDVFIEADIQWIDPPGQPAHKQARVLLKAVDKYTGDVYANETIQSYEREFPGLAKAVEQAFTKDGKTAFDSFLQELDASYVKLLQTGRTMKLKFQVDPGCSFTFTDRIGDERLSRLIRQSVQQHAWHNQYSVIGESPMLIDFTAQVPVVDEQGKSITPLDYLGDKVDQYLHSYLHNQNIDMDYATLGPWINFTLKNTNRKP